MNDRFRLDPQRHLHVHGVVVADGDVPLRQMHQHVIALPLENKHLESDTSLLSTASRIRANRITARYFSRVSRTHIISDSTATRVLANATSDGAMLRPIVASRLKSSTMYRFRSSCTSRRIHSFSPFVSNTFALDTLTATVS